MIKKQPYWLNQTNAAKFFDVTVNTFKSWGIEPIHVDNNSKYYTGAAVLQRLNEMNSKSVSSPVVGENGKIVDYSAELALKTQQERIRLELSNMEKTGELVPSGMFMDAVTLISNHWGASLDSLVLDIKRQVPDIKNSALETIEKLRINLQNELADWDMRTKDELDKLQNGSVDSVKSRTI